MVIVPVDADVDEAGEHGHERHERGEVLAVRHFQFEHHDRDDDGDDAITEGFEPGLAHHLCHAVQRVNGRVLWANLHFLFWLSLFPFTTNWMGENHLTPMPTAVYGFVLFMTAVAWSWYILSRTLVSMHAENSRLERAIGADRKGRISVVMYLAAIALLFWQSWIVAVVYAVVALAWLMPDHRIERIFVNEEADVMKTRIGLISDTHNLVRPEALDALRGVAHIVHAGDICKREVLDALAQLALLTVVRGNNDHADDVASLPEHTRIELNGATIHVIHDIADVPADLTGVDVVVTGHSHKPLIARRDGVLFVNPGSAGPRRFRLPVTIALLDIDGDAIDAEIVRIIE